MTAHRSAVLSTTLARRYSREVGTGRFKHVYKGFDERQGIDIAWSRILQQANSLSDEQMTAIVGELDKGLELDHPNIIRCYRAWHDKEKKCINFITEFFTSGNLRDFRQRHKHLEVSPLTILLTNPSTSHLHNAHCEGSASLSGLSHAMQWWLA